MQTANRRGDLLFTLIASIQIPLDRLNEQVLVVGVAAGGAFGLGFEAAQLPVDLEAAADAFEEGDDVAQRGYGVGEDGLDLVAGLLDLAGGLRDHVLNAAALAAARSETWVTLRVTALTSSMIGLTST